MGSSWNRTNRASGYSPASIVFTLGLRRFASSVHALDLASPRVMIHVLVFQSNRTIDGAHNSLAEPCLMEKTCSVQPRTVLMPVPLLPPVGNRTTLDVMAMALKWNYSASPCSMCLTLVANLLFFSIYVFTFWLTNTFHEWSSDYTWC